MLELLMSVGATKPDFGIAGQAMWDQPGTYTWICPEGVTSICAVVIGGGAHGSGGNNYNIKGGFGGGLRYQNDIPVVPGTSYTIVIAAQSKAVTMPYPSTVPVETAQLMTTAFGLSAGLGNLGTAFSSSVKGGYGCTNTYASFQYGGASGGGSTGTYTNGTDQPSPILNGGFNTSYGLPSDLHGHGNTTIGYGYGGWARGAAAGSSGNVSTGASGKAGGARIIWGNGRAFPSQYAYDV